jgi:hypothetical protein
MALKVADLYGELGLRKDKFDSEMGRVHGMFGRVGAWALAAGAAAGAGIAFGLGKAVFAASDLAESTSKVGVVFGKQAQDIIRWSNDAATAMGMPKQVALEAAGTFGNLFTSMGQSKGVSAEMSRNLVQLAADLSSFNNVPIEEALDALRSGLVGETEPMRRFGVAMDDATLKAKATAMGLKWQGETLPPLIKQQAAYALIMEQTANAQGDYARTSDGFANRWKTLKAQLMDFAAAIGQYLMPVAIAVVGGLQKLLSAVKPYLDSFGGWFKREGPGIAAKMQEMWAVVAPILQTIGQYLYDAFVAAWPTIKAVFEELVATVQHVVGFIRDHWDTIGPIVKNAFKIVETVVKTVLKVIAGVVRAVMAVIRGDWGEAWEHIKSVLSAAWDGIKAIFKHGVQLSVAILKGLGKLALAALAGIGKWLLAKGRELITGLWNGIKEKTSAVLGWLGSLPGKLLGALGDLGSILYNAGVAIISGLWNGIKDKFEDVKDFVGGIGSWISDHKGPLDYDRALLVPAGEAIMAGLRDGLFKGIGPLDAALKDITSRIAIAPNLALGSVPQVTPAVAGGGSPTVVIDARGAFFGRGAEEAVYRMSEAGYKVVMRRGNRTRGTR